MKIKLQGEMVWKEAEVAVPEEKRDSDTVLKEAVINSRKVFKSPAVPALTKSCFLQTAEAFLVVYFVYWEEQVTLSGYSLGCYRSYPAAVPFLPSTGCFIYTSCMCVSNILHYERPKNCFKISPSHVN